MKSYILLTFKLFTSSIIFLFIICSVSCSEDNAVQGLNAGLNGNWLWIKTEGGFYPRVITPTDGTTLIISFEYNRNFILTRNDSVKVSAKYKSEKSDDYWDKLTFSEINTFDFIFNNETEYTRINSDTLIVWDGAIDGFFSFYIKK